jgi:rhodanese-related sulfurtransferase
VRALLLPLLCILAAGTLLGLGYNAVRAKDRIEIGRAYFAALAGAPPTVPGAGAPQVTETWDRAAPPIIPDTGAYLRAVAAGFRMLTVHEAHDYFLAAREAPERIGFLDAREDSLYRAGHIANALQVYYYDTARSVEPILFLLEKVPFLVVYCESVSCDDAFLLCTLLTERYGIPKERLRLYYGGMVHWRAYALPILPGNWVL